MQQQLTSSLSLLSFFDGKFVCKHIFLSRSHFFYVECAMTMHMCEFAIFFLRAVQHKNICMQSNTHLVAVRLLLLFSIACHFRYISLLDNSHSFFLCFFIRTVVFILREAIKSFLQHFSVDDL